MPVQNDIFSKFHTTPIYSPQPVMKEVKTEPKKNFTLSKTDKGAIEILGLSTLAGITMYAGRKSFARMLFNPPEQKTFKPLEGLLDDTLQQATEIVNSKFENIITTGLAHTMGIEELIKYLSLATGKAKKNLLQILSDKYMLFQNCDNNTYIKYMEKQVNLLLQETEHLEYYEPNFIINLSNAYFNTGQKQKSFSIIEQALEKYQKDWSFSYFKAQEMILYSNDKQHIKALEIWNNNQGKAFSYSNTILAAMKSLNEVKGAASACKLFEQVRNTSSEMVDLYVNIAINNGLKNNVLKYAINEKHFYPESTIEFLNKYKDKLQLGEESKKIINLLDELISNEFNFKRQNTEVEFVKKNIELYTKLKNEKLLPEEICDKNIDIYNKYLNTPNEETYKEIKNVKVNLLEYEHPLCVKLIESLGLN